MILSTGLATLTMALVVAQGPRAASQKRKSTTPPAAAVAEKRVNRTAPTPAPRTHPTGAPKRAEPATSAPAPANVSASDSSSANPGASGDNQSGAAPAKSSKTKVYTFGAMDVEGKLKTPQLLYFLNRVKLELEMSAPDHRSFMKELERTAEDPNL